MFAGELAILGVAALAEVAGVASATSGAFSSIALIVGTGGAFDPPVISFTRKVKSPSGTIISPVLQALMYLAS